MIIMDLGRRMTVAYMMNKMAPGIIGSDRSEAYLRAVYGRPHARALTRTACVCEPEFHGMYDYYGAAAVVTFDRLTMRRDAIYQAIEPGRHPEHLLLGMRRDAIYQAIEPGRHPEHLLPEMRRDAIYQAIEPGRHPEHLLLGGTAIAAGLTAELRRVVPAERRLFERRSGPRRS